MFPLRAEWLEWLGNLPSRHDLMQGSSTEVSEANPKNAEVEFSFKAHMYEVH